MNYILASENEQIKQCTISDKRDAYNVLVHEKQS